MKITKIPAPYSPAYRDALFRISATADEIVELDISTTQVPESSAEKGFTGRLYTT